MGSRAGDSYEINACIGKAAAAPTVGNDDVGLKYNGNCAAHATAADNTVNDIALSITDFNLFRLRVVDAFDQIDDKIRKILKKTDLDCA